MPKQLPALDTEGWLGSVVEKANRALMHFYVARFSDPYLSRGEIIPLNYLMATYGATPAKFQEELIANLEKYLATVFDSVIVNAERVDDPTGLTIQLDVMVSEGDTAYNLGHIIKSANGSVLRIFDMVNEGIVYEPPTL